MASWEADADIAAVSFHSRTPNKVSGTLPGPDVGERSQRVGMGDMLLPESESCRDLSWAGQPGSGTKVGAGLAALQLLALSCGPRSIQGPGIRRETRNESVSEEIGVLDLKTNDPSPWARTECPLSL